MSKNESQVSKDWQEVKARSSEVLHDAHAIYFEIADICIYLNELPFPVAHKLQKIRPKLLAELTRHFEELRELYIRVLSLGKFCQTAERKLRDGRAERKF